MNIRPLNDRVVVKRKEVEKKTSSGLYIPETQQEKQQQGTVLAVGKNSELSVGDVVMFGKHAGMDFEHEGEQLVFLRDNDIFAVL